MQDRSSADETDAGDDLSRDASVVAEVLDCERIRKNCEQGCAETNKHIGTQPGGTVPEFTLQADRSP